MENGQAASVYKETVITQDESGTVIYLDETLDWFFSRKSCLKKSLLAFEEKKII